jgi:hypothetical protein
MSSEAASSKGLNIALWIAQVLLALSLAGGAIWKLTTSIPDLASKMPWMGQVSPSFLYMTATFDLLGGLGVILPSLTRVMPKVTVLAAIGCIALMVGAIVFHVSRGEADKTPFNFFLIALAAFVAWGRFAKAPIAPRA